MLTELQKTFLTLLVEREALRFGSFTLKSGRQSPFFINTGCFNKATDIAALGHCYAQTIIDKIGTHIDTVFGPAYKGIPLALGAAQEFTALTQKPIGWTYDRKEVKDHGDGGLFVGYPLSTSSKIVLVDDVMTAGTAIRESMQKLQPTGADVCGIVISVDRMENGANNITAREEIAQEFNTPVHAIITIREAVDYLCTNDINGTRYLSETDRQTVYSYLDQK